MSSVKSIHPIGPRVALRLAAPASGPAERLARFRTAGAELRGARDFLLPLEQLE